MTMIQNVGGDRNAPYVAGDYLDLVVTAVDGDGDPIDISGAAGMRYSISAMLSNGEPTGPSLLTKSLGSGVALTNGAAGVFTITLANGDTGGMPGVHYHEAEMIDSEGRVVTLFRGSIAVTRQLILPA